MSITATRHKTGESCPNTGIYGFDGYFDGTKYPRPTAEEEQIPLSRGEVFPPIRSASKACFWVFLRRS